MDGKQHPYAHILRAIADGETIQLRDSEDAWCDASADNVLALIGNGIYLQQGIRVKPRTLTINGYEVPEPCRVAPEIGQVYWVAGIDTLGLVCSYVWNDGAFDRLSLSRGMIHSTHEAARAHATALLSFTSSPETKP